MCSGSSVCEGGARAIPVLVSGMWPADAWMVDDFYIPCTECKSGYKRVEQGNWYFIYGVLWEVHHAPRRECKIFGQSVPKPLESSDCECPANSVPSYSFSRYMC